MDNQDFARTDESAEISSADLLRECGQKLTDRDLWTLFQSRFQRLIFLYVLRAMKFHSRRGSIDALCADLSQDVYVRLVHANGKALRTFRGTTEFSVRTLLARVAVSVVTDHLRHEGSAKRHSDNVVSIDEARDMIEASRTRHAHWTMSPTDLRLDIDKALESDPDRRNAARNIIIFQLHYFEGLTAEEIADCPGFGLNSSGVEAVLGRLRKRFKT